MNDIFDTPPTSDERTIVRRAIEILQTDGWTQDAYRNGAGQYCAIGALTAARGGTVTRGGDGGWNTDVQLTEHSPLARKIEFLLRSAHELEDWEFIPDWNDHPETTAEQVIATLELFA